MRTTCQLCVTTERLVTHAGNATKAPQCFPVNPILGTITTESDTASCENFEIYAPMLFADPNLRELGRKQTSR